MEYLVLIAKKRQRKSCSLDCTIKMLWCISNNCVIHFGNEYSRHKYKYQTNKHTIETSLKWLPVGIPLLETSERLVRDW